MIKMLFRLLISLVIAALYLTIGYYGMELINFLTPIVRGFAETLPQLITVFITMLGVITTCVCFGAYTGIAILGVVAFPSFVLMDSENESSN